MIDAARPLVVVALGGNAMQAPDGDDSVEADFTRTAETSEHLVRLSASGNLRMVVTHGNGPQVGNHLLRSELGHRDGGLPLLPLDVCVADTQGGMGYVLQQSLGNAFGKTAVPAVVTTVVTQVLVDPEDPAFGKPTKPVGEIIPESRRAALESQGWMLVEDERRGGWRRVVASPDPVEIVEAAAIKALIDDGVLVIACGGGGVPVVQRAGGGLSGVAAVIDKDLASALLAHDLGARGFMILTDVSEVSLGYGTSQERPIAEMTVSEARGYLTAGEFGAGTMAPKIEAMCRFAEGSGSIGITTSIRSCEEALAGRAGTRIVPDM